MKLRTKYNSIRFRLTQSEVASFARDGRVSETIAFGPGEQFQFRYHLVRFNGNEPSASLNDREITVFVPVDIANSWCESEQVGFENSYQIEGEEPLRILIEKDFQCLKPRPEEDESDNFPNPQALDL